MKKTVLITGASRGIGRACAELFYERGYNVVANYLNSEEETKKLIKKCPQILAVRADVSDFSQVREMFEKAKQRFGNIDILVNNSGVALQKLFTDTTEEEWRRVFAINTDGVFNCCRFAVEDMIKKHSGKIINISSVWGECGASCEVAYSASKSAVIGFTKALAKELGPSGICVNCITPGVIKTDMNKCLDEETLNELKEETPLQRIGKAEDVAKTVLFLASQESDFITGQVFGVNGGFLI